MATQHRKNNPRQNFLNLFKASMWYGPTNRECFYLDELKNILVSTDIYNLILNTKTSDGKPWIPVFFWQVGQFPQPYTIRPEDDFPDYTVLAVANGTEFSAVISISLDNTQIWYRMFNNDVRQKGLTDGLMYACTQSVHYGNDGLVFYDSVFVSIVEYYGRVPSSRTLKRDPRAKQIMDTSDLDDQQKMDHSKIYIETQGYIPGTFDPRTYSLSINRTEDDDEPNVFEFHNGSEGFWANYTAVATGRFVELFVWDVELEHWQLYPGELLGECHELGPEAQTPILDKVLGHDRGMDHRFW